MYWFSVVYFSETRILFTREKRYRCNINKLFRLLLGLIRWCWFILSQASKIDQTFFKKTKIFLMSQRWSKFPYLPIWIFKFFFTTLINFSHCLFDGAVKFFNCRNHVTQILTGIILWSVYHLNVEYSECYLVACT